MASYTFLSYLADNCIESNGKKFEILNKQNSLSYIFLIYCSVFI